MFDFFVFPIRESNMDVEGDGTLTAPSLSDTVFTGAALTGTGAGTGTGTAAATTTGLTTLVSTIGAVTSSSAILAYEDLS